MKRTRLLAILGVPLAGVALVGAALAGVKLVYGAGSAFEDVGSAPLVLASEVDVLAELPLPPACVAVSSTGRVFVDLHDFGKPKRFGETVLYEIIDGQPVAWPSAAAQADLRAPFGMTVDAADRLWLVESGGIEGHRTRVVAYDVEDGAKVEDFELPNGVGRFAQDLRVSPDGQTLLLADTGAFAFTEASLLVIDLNTHEVIRTFSDHSGLQVQDWVMHHDGVPYRIGGGLVTFQVGLDGVAITPDGRWVHLASMSHDTLYRVPLSVLRDPSVSDDAVAGAFEVIGSKPLSDGIAVDALGRTYVTDVEHGGIDRIDLDGTLVTLARHPEATWADGVALLPDGGVVFTDSAIPRYIQPWLTPPPLETIEAGRPYRVYRIPPVTTQ